MAGPPLRPGSVQLTSRLVCEPEVATTEGAAGLSTFSFTSVTSTVRERSVVAVPSDTRSVTR